MSISKCSLFNCFSRTSTADPAKTPSPFRVTEFLAKNPIPEGTDFTSAHRAWAYLTLGTTGHFDPTKASKMEQSVMKFFKGVRTICQGKAFDIHASFEEILQQTQKSPGNAFHVLKTALREAEHALKQPDAPKQGIEELISFLKKEIQTLAPTEKKRKELEKAPFKTSHQLKKEAERHCSISWKTLAFLGGLFATGGVAAASGHTLYQKSLIGNELTWNQRQSVGSELTFCQDLRPDFVRNAEQMQIDARQKRERDQVNAPHFFTTYARDQEYARIAREMIKEGLYDEAIPKVALKISDPETRLDIYKETIQSIMEKKGPQSAVEFAKKIPKDADRELHHGIRDRTYQSLLRSLCNEGLLEKALEAASQLFRGYFYRDDAYETIIKTMMHQGMSEGLLEIADKIEFVQTYEAVNTQIFEFFLSKGDFEGASKTIPNLARHLQKKAQQEIIKAQNNERRVPLAPECANEFSAQNRIFIEDSYDAVYRRAARSKKKSPPTVDSSKETAAANDKRQIATKLVEAGNIEGALKIADSANFDAPFHQNLIQQALAVLSKMSDGRVKVRNQGYRQIVEHQLARAHFEGILEIPRRILLDQPLRMDVYKQIFDAEFAAGDFAKALETVPHCGSLREHEENYKKIAVAQAAKKDFSGALNTLEKFRMNFKLYGEAFSYILDQIQVTDLTETIKDELVSIANHRLWKVDTREKLWVQLATKLILVGDATRAIRLCFTDNTPNPVLKGLLDDLLSRGEVERAQNLLDEARKPAQNEPKQRCPDTTYIAYQAKINSVKG